MSEEDFQKERRDWWKENYINAVNNALCHGSIRPVQEASEALELFDKRFKEEGDDYRDLKTPEDQEQGGIPLTTKQQEFLKSLKKWRSKS